MAAPRVNGESSPKFRLLFANFRYSQSPNSHKQQPPVTAAQPILAGLHPNIDRLRVATLGPDRSLNPLESLGVGPVAPALFYSDSSRSVVTFRDTPPA